MVAFWRWGWWRWCDIDGMIWLLTVYKMREYVDVIERECVSWDRDSQSGEVIV